MKKSIFALFVALLVVGGMPGLGFAHVVTSPTAGETLTMGASYNIQWTPIVGTTNVVIHYSVDGGTTWVNASGSTPDDGSYTWTVPFVASTNCKILITDADGYPGGTATGAFTIVDDGTNRLILTAPNGGEQWVAGKSYNITWLSTGSTGDVKIEYSINNGTAWTSISNSATNNGTYSWTVPATTSTQCLVRISEASDSDPTDNSNGAFAIVTADTAVLNLTYPNGGVGLGAEGLKGGANTTITWNTNGAIYNVKFEYSSDNGSSWNLIGTAVNSGSYSWKVPNLATSQCKVRISDSLDSNPTDSSSATFFVFPNPGVTDKITVTSPNGGETFIRGNSHNVTWTSEGAIGNVKIEYTTNNGSSWNVAKASTSNSGTYSWPVPSTTSTQCKVRVTRAEETSVSDSSDAIFTISDPVPTITIQSPVGGESWQIGTVKTITWSSYGGVGDVKIEYSTNNKSKWTTITAATSNDGSYSWTVPDISSTTCFIRISEASDGSPTTTNTTAFAISVSGSEPTISINRTSLLFCASRATTAVTPAQTILVRNSGGGTMNWEAYSPNDWIRLVGAYGSGEGAVTVTVLPTFLESGTYSGIITFSSEEATNSPVTIVVTLTVYPPLVDAEPFGSFETPTNDAIVRSSIPVTGWALDDVGIERVIIKRDRIAGEGSGEAYIGDAVLVEGARPDVELVFPGYPLNYRAGWGYMLLTNMLPNSGNGSFTLHAYAQDGSGHEVLLGSKTIVCDNINAVKPFGAIDTPIQGGTASGDSFRNQGWVLTPLPNTIPTSGSTIEAFIDGVSIGHLNYNIYRADIHTLFPNYNNSLGSLAFLDFDTTQFESGVHTIQWTATDGGGNTDGIGSRYFVIQQNAGYPRGLANRTNQLENGTPNIKHTPSTEQLEQMPLEEHTTVQVKTGYGNKLDNNQHRTDKDGTLCVTIPEMERLVLDLEMSRGCIVTGYQQVGKELRHLPIGSTIDSQRGIFYWQPGAGFLGDFQMVFVFTDTLGNSTKKSVQVSIQPKSNY